MQLSVDEQIKLETEINKRLSKFLHHNKTSEKQQKIADIPIDSDLIGDLGMDKIIKIALKTTKPGSKVKPLDKILLFLQD